jgi:hypothetical protein
MEVLVEEPVAAAGLVFDPVVVASPERPVNAVGGTDRADQTDLTPTPRA